jgi:hypothetical protein
MIRFVLTAGHGYTIQALGGRMGIGIPPCEGMTYDHLFETDRLPAGSYIFCDHERLSDMELRVAAAIFAELKADPACRVFNDPARVRVRYGLLRALRERGLNSFDAYRADGLPRPRRFPVFIRAETDHDDPVSPLIHSQADLDAALKRLEAAGRPLRGLIVIEFCGEPYRPGIWRRWAGFRLGGSTFLHSVATDTQWAVKVGRFGLLDESTYAEDDAAIRRNDHAVELAAAFDAAAIDYGRADFGLVAGRPEVYEINTNPLLAASQSHPSPIRSGTIAFARQRFVGLLAAMDLPAHSDPIEIRNDVAAAHRAMLRDRNTRYFELGRRTTGSHA